MPAKERTPSITVPPVKKPVVKKAPVKAVVKAPVKKAAVKAAPKKVAAKKPQVVVSDELIQKLVADFGKGGAKRDAEGRGAITAAQKALLAKEAKKLGMTPSALVAAIITAWLLNR